MTELPEAGRHALITGASGGIGEAFVNLLAQEGYRLVIAARNADQLNRVTALAVTNYQADVTPVDVDLSRHDSGEILARAMAAKNFSPDVVINNAGFGKLGAAHSIDRAEQLNMVDLNVRCATDLSLRFLPEMLQRKRGGILNVASLAGFMPGPNMAVYYATKNYLVAFGEAIATELKGTGVSVSTLCPGVVITGFQARAEMEDSLLTKLMPKQSAQEVALAGWEGFKRGERIIVPGAFNKIAAHLSRITPRSISLPVINRLQKLQNQKAPNEPA